MGERGTLPPGWVWTTLSEAATVLDSKRVPINADEREQRIANKKPHEVYPYFGATGQVGWIDDYLFDEELVLLGEDGAPFLDPGKSKAYIIKGRTWVNNHAHVLRAISGLTLNSYLMHTLNVFDYHGYVTGTTRLKLNQSEMRKIPIPLPPLPEQHRIVAEIEELFTQLDAGVAALKRVQANLKRYRASVLKAACEGRLAPQDPADEPADRLLARILAERRAKWEAEHPGKRYVEPAAPVTAGLPELPGGWCWAALPQLGELARGKSKHRPRNDARLYGGPYPFVQTGEVKQADGTITAYSQTYNEVGLAQSRLWPKGTLCITIAANIAETAILGFDACFPDSVVGFIGTKEACNVRFVEYFIRTAKNDLERYAPATAQKNINLDTLEKLAIALPPLPEQHRIVAEVERRLSVVAEVEATVTVNLARAGRLRQAVLKRAFEGRLVGQDAHGAV